MIRITIDIDGEDELATKEAVAVLLEPLASESDRGCCPGGCLKNYADPFPHCGDCTFGGKQDA